MISAPDLAFAEGEDTKLADRHVQQAITTTVPLSQSMGKRITALRAEAKDKWRPASGGSEAAAAQVGSAAIAEPPPVPKKPKRVFEV